MTSQPIKLVAIALAFGGLVTACAEEELVPVSVDLCLATGLTAEERGAIVAPDVRWTISLWVIEAGDFIEVKALGTQIDPSGLSTENAVPQGVDVRIFAQGRPIGQSETVGMAMSTPRVFSGGEQVCLCVAPPERFDELCDLGDCQGGTTGSCPQ